MALSEDSRSLLQLLLARNRSYSDIADLLGIDVADVRNRAHAALAEIADSDPDRDTNLTDYLLGQADPIARADTARVLSENPEAMETASDLVAQLRLLVPQAELPKLDPTAGSLVSGATATTASGSMSSRNARPTEEKAPRSSLSMSQRRLLAAVLLAATLIAVVLLVVILIGGDGDSTQVAEQPAATTSVLRPVAGQSGRGVVNFGFSGTQLAAQLQFNDLEPTEQGQSYVVWLYGPGGSFPINQARVDDAGAIAGQVSINQALICFIAGDLFPDTRLSRVEDGQMRAALQQARSAPGSAELPEFTGELVLEGPISMPQEAKDEILPVCNR